MFCADAVMYTVKPALQVAEYEVGDRQELLGNVRIAAFGYGVVVVASCPEAIIAAPVVGNDQRAGRDGALDEATQRICATVSGDGQPDSTGVAAILPLVLRGAWLPVAHLDGRGHQCLMVDASAFAARPSADQGFVYLDMSPRLAADPVLVGPHHASTELMEYLEGGLIARQTKLPLELDGRDAGGMTGNQIGCPEPHAQRRVAALHDCADHQSRVPATFPAAQYARAVIETKRLSARLTVRANEPAVPAGLFQIGSACRVVGEKALELRKRLWEGQAGVVENIHGPSNYPPGAHTAPASLGRQADSSPPRQNQHLVGVGINRIGKVRGCRSLTPAGRPAAVPGLA